MRRTRSGSEHPATMAKASDTEKAYSPAIVEKRFPPSIVNEASKRKGSVAIPKATGTGRGARSSRPMAYAAQGMRNDPSSVTSLKLTANPTT